MAPRVDPVPSDEKLPARADVVIVGGGIIGASTALFLAQRGVSAVLCEKGHIAGEQSSRNWGWCRKMARDPREIPLIIESLRLWERMNGTVDAETGFRTSGIMYLGETAEELGHMEAWLEHAREYQLDTRLIDGAEVARLLPGVAKPWAGALYTPSDGKAEPQLAAPAIAAGAHRRGATIPISHSLPRRNCMSRITHASRLEHFFCRYRGSSYGSCGFSVKKSHVERASAAQSNRKNALVGPFLISALLVTAPAALLAQSTRTITGQDAFTDYSKQKPGTMRKITVADLAAAHAG